METKTTVLKTHPHLTRWEQETIINFNSEEKVATLFTYDPVMIRRMDKLVAAQPGDFSVKDEAIVDGKVLSRTYVFPKKAAYPHKVVHIVMTEEQREAARERLSNFRKTQQTAPQPEQ